MTILCHPPPRSVEEYMAREREQDIWEFPQFVRYLRALIFKLTPKPHHCAQMVIDAADEILAEQCAPRQLRHLLTNVPTKPGHGRAARELANAICEVVGYWAGFMGTQDIKVRDANTAHNGARHAAMEGERAARDKTQLTPDDLYQCAVVAQAGSGSIDDNRRDAALAAMSAGHFQLAREIATGAPGENN